MIQFISKFFWRLAAYDPDLLATCPRPEKRLALVTGVSLLVLFFLMLASCLYLNFLLFNALYLALIVGSLIAFTLISLYRFLLSSLLSYRFPETGRRSIAYFSWAVRFIYLLFLVLLISKPVELYCLKNQLEEDLIIHRQKKEAEFKLRLSVQLGKERTNLKDELQSVELKSREDPESDLYTNRMTSLEEQLVLLNKREEELLQSFSRQNQKAAYFIPRLKFLLRNYPISWLISLGILLLFGLPVFLEAKKKKRSKYQLRCDNIDLKLILSHYQHFLQAYRTIFKTEYDIEIRFEEHSKNPPFNTIPKQARPMIRDKDLLLKHLKK